MPPLPSRSRIRYGPTRALTASAIFGTEVRKIITAQPFLAAPADRSGAGGLQIRRALRTTRRLLRDVRDAVRTRARGRGDRRGIEPRQQRRERLDHEEVDDRGLDHEGDDRVDEVADVDRAGL